MLWIDAGICQENFDTVFIVEKQRLKGNHGSRIAKGFFEGLRRHRGIGINTGAA